MIRNFLSIVVIIHLLTSGLTIAQNPAYSIFTSKGEAIEYEDMVNNLVKSDMIFFGELHNDPIAHWLELRLLKDVTSMSSKKPVVGAEMFEADDQLILNEYLSGLIKERHFRKEAKLWDNYATDYRPLVEYAKKNKLNFIATNIPRRYAALVSAHGFDILDTLSIKAKNYIAPLPIKYNPDLPGYKRMLEMNHMHGMSQNKNLPKAQAIKDATMAHFILKNYNETGVFLHFNGTYHSNNKEGIVWYINQHNPGVNVKTIATVRQESLDELKDENLGIADYIIVVPHDMTNTY